MDTFDGNRLSMRPIEGGQRSPWLTAFNIGLLLPPLQTFRT